MAPAAKLSTATSSHGVATRPVEVLARDAVVVDTDTIGVGVQWSENSNSDDFSKSLIRARCEGRFATSIYAPLGVVVGDLTP